MLPWLAVAGGGNERWTLTVHASHFSSSEFRCFIHMFWPSTMYLVVLRSFVWFDTPPKLNLSVIIGRAIAYAQRRQTIAFTDLCGRHWL
jgi:hypothetical protein